MYILKVVVYLNLFFLYVFAEFPCQINSSNSYNRVLNNIFIVINNTNNGNNSEGMGSVHHLSDSYTSSDCVVTYLFIIENAQNFGYHCSVILYYSI